MGTPNDSGLGLVLSGGGAQAAYQVGVLAALGSKAPDLTFPIITGASAGAINAAYLAGHEGTLPEVASGLAGEWTSLTTERVYGNRGLMTARAALRWFSHLFSNNGSTAESGILELRPLRAFLAGCLDFNGIETRIREGRLHSVALDATAYATGTTVTFVQGAQGIEIRNLPFRAMVRTALTLDHVMASLAIPLAFPAVRIGENFYCDGSVRQHYPLAPAIHLGARKLLVIGSSPVERRSAIPASNGGYPSAAATAGLVLNSIFVDALNVDAERLTRLNRLIASLPPGVPPPEGLRPIDLMILRPTCNLRSIAEVSVEQLSQAMRVLLRITGMRRKGGAELLSYLLFDPAYSRRVIDLGFTETLARWPEIERFLSPKSQTTPGDPRALPLDSDRRGM